MSHYGGEAQINASQKAYERHAWMLLFALGIVISVYGIYFLSVGVPPDAKLVKSITGGTWDELVASSPGATTFLRTETFRVLGMTLLGVATYAMAIAAVPYRKGAKWSWYISWNGPVVFAGMTANNLGVGGGYWPVFIMFLIIALLGLLLPYRNFFPRRIATEV